MTVDPHGLLAKVEPDLAKVVQKAWEAYPHFIVVYGVRSVAAERQAVESGHSTTMHSRHLPDKHGFAAAVDLASVDAQGHINWANGHEAAAYTPIATAMKAAGHTFGVPVEWGGDWTTFKDWGHFQLPWSQYP